MAGPGDDNERRMWDDVSDVLNGAGDLPNAPVPPLANIKKGAPEKSAAAGVESEEDERFTALIEELIDRELGDAIVCSYGSEDEEEPDYDLVGYIIPGSNVPDKVVALFNNGFFCVITAPKNATLATFRADFLPGKGAYPIQMALNEDMTAEKRFISTVMERCDPKRLLRSDLKEDEVEAWETFKRVLENAERLKAERLGTQERQSERVWGGLLQLLGHEPPEAAENEAGEA